MRYSLLQCWGRLGETGLTFQTVTKSKVWRRTQPDSIDLQAEREGNPHRYIKGCNVGGLKPAVVNCGSLLEACRDFTTTSDWASNLTYCWGKLYKCHERVTKPYEPPTTLGVSSSISVALCLHLFAWNLLSVALLTNYLGLQIGGLYSLRGGSNP